VTLSSGFHLGPYVIVRLLGSGGMGEVYQARDPRLQRTVALKILREPTASSHERVHRFEQEARAASALNHPNIVVVYDIGEAAVKGQPSIPFLVMELVDGQPLGARIRAGRLRVSTILDLAAQVADGLARAHEAGIVHRDLKPGNILVTNDGLVKIVDFGLAKLREPIASASDGITLDDVNTSVSTVRGTPSYMSPEQVRGEDATPASDQFALGCVLYEMLTGRRAFERPSTAETISAVLRDDPRPISSLRPDVPAPLRWIVQRCLSKEARDRYTATRDLARDLKTLRDHSDEITDSTPVKRPPFWRRLLMPAAAVLLVGLTAGATLLLSSRNRSATEPEFRRLTFRRGNVHRALFVPGSNAVLYTATWEGQETGAFTMLPDTPGLERRLDSEERLLPMAFSPDGSEALVLLGSSHAGINARGTLAVWPAVGGRSRPIVENAGWADWSGSRFVVFVRDLGAEHALICRDGGTERTLFRTSGALSYVRISPDARDVAFIHHASRADDSGEVRIARTDGSGTARAITPVFERCLGLEWNRKTGEIWFTASHAPHGSSLFAVSTSGERRTLQALPEFAVLESISTDGARSLLTLRDESTTLAVRRGAEPSRDMTWLGLSLAADVSPDGKTVLFWDGGGNEKSSGVWLRPVDGGEALRLGDGEPKRFSPDGKAIVAVTRPVAGATRFLLIPVGAGTTRAVVPPDADSTSPSFAGAHALLFVRRISGRTEVWTMRTDGTSARSLGAADCDVPMASPVGDSFVAVCGDGGRALEVHSMTNSFNRRLFELPPDDTFLYARWDAKAARVFGLTSHRRLLTIDALKGAVLADERLPFLPEQGEQSGILAGAISPDGTVQAYSARRTSSRLYVGDQLR
jgi:serine/threonine protein kinase